MSKILIVEDDLSVSSLYKEVFVEAGYETFIANDGLSGIKLAEEIHPDIILLDVMMPKLDGMETLKRLKSLDSVKQIPVLMLTNVGVDMMKNEALSLGAERFLVKTEYDNDMLVREVSSYIRS